MSRIALKYGILIVVFIFLWGVLEYMGGVHVEFMHYRPVLALLSLTIPMIFIYLGIRESQNSFSEHFTYGQAFKSGLLITLVVAVLNPIGQWLFLSVVSPDFFAAIQAHHQPELNEGGAGNISLTGYLLRSAFLGPLIAGVVISAILAIFVRDPALPKER